MHETPGGAARLHRLPRRRRGGRAATATLPHDRPGLRRRARPGARAAAVSREPGTARRSANPKRSYALLNREAPEFVRFVNPTRLPRRARGLRRLPHRDDRGGRALADGDRARCCGAARPTTTASCPTRTTCFGEAYTREGEPAQDRQRRRPAGHGDRRRRRRAARSPSSIRCRPGRSIPPGDVFRVFERGGRNIGTQFAEIGLPNPTGLDPAARGAGPARPQQSNRGPGTGLRVAIPVLNIHKTRLNDPFMWFMGTNDQPGDYRHSGCAGCHVIYANDREPRHSLTYAQVRPRRADARRSTRRSRG